MFLTEREAEEVTHGVGHFRVCSGAGALKSAEDDFLHSHIPEVYFRAACNHDKLDGPKHCVLN